MLVPEDKVVFLLNCTTRDQLPAQENQGTVINRKSYMRDFYITHHEYL